MNDHILFEFIFDATDMSRGHFCIGFNIFENSISNSLLQFFKDNDYAFIEKGVKLGSKMYKKILIELEAAKLDIE